jgi:hypothetical protein
MQFICPALFMNLLTQQAPRPRSQCGALRRAFTNKADQDISDASESLFLNKLILQIFFYSGNPEQR